MSYFLSFQRLGYKRRPARMGIVEGDLAQELYVKVVEILTKFCQKQGVDPVVCEGFQTRLTGCKIKLDSGLATGDVFVLISAGTCLTELYDDVEEEWEKLDAEPPPPPPPPPPGEPPTGIPWGWIAAGVGAAAAVVTVVVVASK